LFVKRPYFGSLRYFGSSCTQAQEVHVRVIVRYFCDTTSTSASVAYFGASARQRASQLAICSRVQR
jgi:hypothetical protein